MNGLITKPDLTTACDFGSQMLEYASLLGISKKTNTTPFIIQESMTIGKGYPMNDAFDHRPTVYSLENLKNISFEKLNINPKEENIDYDLFKLDSTKNYIYYDLIGSFKYFHDIKDKIINLYRFKEEIVKFCQEYIKTIRNENDILVSIHFRRGDYLTESSLNLSLEYYKHAVIHMERLYPDKNIKYLIFSNDLPWVKENFNTQKNIYVENLNRFQDMCLMTMCDSNIIANSTFSWWGAYLNLHENKKVICPSKYVNDDRFNYINKNYYPNDWISLDIL